jgi:hypothetical protein
MIGVPTHTYLCLHRAKPILHKASKTIVGIVAREKVKPVMEKLKNIRECARDKIRKKDEQKAPQHTLQENTVLHLL